MSNSTAGKWIIFQAGKIGFVCSKFIFVPRGKTRKATFPEISFPEIRDKFQKTVTLIKCRSPSAEPSKKTKPRKPGGKGRKGSHVTRYPAGRPPGVGCSERRAQGRKARLALFLFLSVSFARRAQTSPSEGRRLKEGRRDDVCGGAAPPGRAHRDGRLRVVVLLLFLNVVPPVPRWTTTTTTTAKPPFACLSSGGSQQQRRASAPSPLRGRAAEEDLHRAKDAEAQQ